MDLRARGDAARRAARLAVDRGRGRAEARADRARGRRRARRHRPARRRARRLGGPRDHHRRLRADGRGGARARAGEPAPRTSRPGRWRPSGSTSRRRASTRSSPAGATCCSPTPRPRCARRGACCSPAAGIAIAVWEPMERNPWIGVILRELAARDLAPLPEPGAPGMFALAAPGLAEELLEAAGFGEVRREPIEFAFRARRCRQLVGAQPHALDLARQGDRRPELRPSTTRCATRSTRPMRTYQARRREPDAAGVRARRRPPRPERRGRSRSREGMGRRRMSDPKKASTSSTSASARIRGARAAREGHLVLGQLHGDAAGGGAVQGRAPQRRARSGAGARLERRRRSGRPGLRARRARPGGLVRAARRLAHRPRGAERAALLLADVR